MSWLPVVFALLCAVCVVSLDPIVSTSYGKLQGTTDPKDSGFYSFKSVPFAKPPVGNLRFSLPQAPEPWNHTLTARNYSAPCIGGSASETAVENCLYMNIFTSQHCLAEKCPVIVFFHGNTPNADSAVAFQDDYIRERYVSEGIVFVIPAYRLGVFAQLHFDSLSANLNVQDTLAALKFVHQEIGNFGGDSNQVTIMGEGSGADIVTAISFSRRVDPKKVLFHQVVALNPTGRFVDNDLLVDDSQMLSRYFKCLPSKKVLNRHCANPQAIIFCLQNVASKDLFNQSLRLKSWSQGSVAGLPLIEKNEKLRRNPPPRPMILGVSINSNNKSEALDNRVFDSVAELAQEMTKTGGNVFVFKSQISQIQLLMGSPQGDFGQDQNIELMARLLSELLVTFVRKGSPSSKWNKYDLKRRNVLALQVNLIEGVYPEMRHSEEEDGQWTAEMVDSRDSLLHYKSDKPEVDVQNAAVLIVFLLFSEIVFVIVCVSFLRHYISQNQLIPRIIISAEDFV